MNVEGFKTSMDQFSFPSLQQLAFQLSSKISNSALIDALMGWESHTHTCMVSIEANKSFVDIRIFRMNVIVLLAIRKEE